MKRHPILISALLLVSLLGSLVHAQTTTRATPCDPATPTNAICVTHAAVTTRTDGQPTTFPVTYRLEQKLGAGGFTTVETTATLNHYVKNLVPGDYTFRVFAIENLIVSDASNTASKSIIQAPPSAPVLIIAATIKAGQAPTFRVIYTVTPRNDEVVFVAPESMRPVFASR